MLLIEYVGHIGLRNLNDGHLGRHLEYFKTLNDARVASVGLIKCNVSTTRINKEKKTLKSSSRSFWFSTGLVCVSEDALLKLGSIQTMIVFQKQRLRRRFGAITMQLSPHSGFSC